MLQVILYVTINFVMYPGHTVKSGGQMRGSIMGGPRG